MSGSLLSNNLLNQRKDKSHLDEVNVNDARNRERIALTVLVVSLLAVIGLSVTVIRTANNNERGQLSTRVMDSTLPLYGTWVGTILAFYFSRNAFEAASNSAIRIQQVTSGSVSGPPPEDKLSKIALKSLANDLIFTQSDLNKPLQDVVNELESKGRYRTIVVDANKQYVDLIYRINAEAYLKPQQGNVSASPTLKNYLDWRNGQEKGRPSIVFLPQSATLADADAKMKATIGCRDVIVTTDGQYTSPVVVYVTDYDIEQYR